MNILISRGLSGVFIAAFSLQAVQTIAQERPAPPASRPRVIVLAMRGERLGEGTPTDGAFRNELLRLGWDDTRVTIEHHDVNGGVTALPAAAEAVAAEKPDIIVASGTNQALAAHRATSTIPIVYVGALDHSLTKKDDLKPNGNVTGVVPGEDFWPNKVRLLKRLIPDLKHIYIIADPTYLTGWPEDAVESAARALKLESTRIRARSVGELREFFATTGREAVEGVVVINSPTLARSIMGPLGRFAVSNKLAVAAPYVQYAQAGALLSYDEDSEFWVRRQAAYVDRILRGAKPADLPFERVDKPRIAINLQTAQKLGLSIPADVLLSAAVIPSLVNLSLATTVQATDTTAAEIERQVIDNERAIAAAFLRHDASVAERFFADDFREIVPSGRIFTKADMVRQAANSDFTQMDIFEPSVQVVKPDVAIYTARYVETRKQSPTAEPVTRQVRLLVVWVLRNGKWQIVAGQNRPIP